MHQMKAIRVVAAGLLASAVLMSQLATPFFKSWTSSSVNAFVNALNTLSPGILSVTGMGATAVIVLLLFSLGLGLFLSTTLYSPLDDYLVGWAQGRVSNGSSAGASGADKTASA
jgi:hypothetical protein